LEVDLSGRPEAFAALRGESREMKVRPVVERVACGGSVCLVRLSE
jgi:hypothetical protein